MESGNKNLSIEELQQVSGGSVVEYEDGKYRFRRFQLSISTMER